MCVSGVFMHVKDATFSSFSQKLSWDHDVS